MKVNIEVEESDVAGFIGALWGVLRPMTALPISDPAPQMQRVFANADDREAQLEAEAAHYLAQRNEAIAESQRLHAVTEGLAGSLRGEILQRQSLAAQLESVLGALDIAGNDRDRWQRDFHEQSKLAEDLQAQLDVLNASDLPQIAPDEETPVEAVKVPENAAQRDSGTPLSVSPSPSLLTEQEKQHHADIASGVGRGKPEVDLAWQLPNGEMRELTQGEARNLSVAQKDARLIAQKRFYKEREKAGKQKRIAKWEQANRNGRNGAAANGGIKDEAQRKAEYARETPGAAGRLLRGGAK